MALLCLTQCLVELLLLCLTQCILELSPHHLRFQQNPTPVCVVGGWCLFRCLGPGQLYTWAHFSGVKSLQFLQPCSARAVHTLLLLVCGVCNGTTTRMPRPRLDVGLIADALVIRLCPRTPPAQWAIPPHLVTSQWDSSLSARVPFFTSPREFDNTDVGSICLRWLSISVFGWWVCCTYVQCVCVCEHAAPHQCTHQCWWQIP